MVDTKVKKLLPYIREEMPIYDESIFFPEVERRKLGITDEEMESIVEYFRWQFDQDNKRKAKHRLIELLKLRPQQLILQKKLELERDLELIKTFSR